MNPTTSTSVSPSVKATAQSFLAAREENSHTPAMKNHVEGFVASLGSKAGEPLV